MDVVGRFDTSVGEELSATIYVIDNDTDSLLCTKTATTLGLVQCINSVSFGEVKCQPVKIMLKDWAMPYSVTTARCVPIPLLKKVEQDIKRMKDGGVIEEITEET